MVDVELTLVGKPGCHLCDDARTVVEQVVADLGAEASVAVSEVSILDDPELHERFVEEIPVVLIDGRVHTFWRVDPVRLRRALLDRG
ncbi:MULTISPECIES: glutaredoxin family protein [unclassified Rathayibacter]|uniref:glutaredoxin family protein n=1 Tax=unclassified Rathayibacter TaxID=2609250 RepID=UPI000CE89BF4|nr:MULTISPECIES: glutaredoxin family protein [unclassified Rathayibacter]PPF36179.1 thioredoxin family protein [Rathayibacter sp. AY1A2]PPF57143.1 thioredoxin family protein [Rathayibacter sp. AY1C2]PPG34194.1 thioredoxin family protein [Rathayibacter sp. AY2B9]PPG63482.1 thioredoxin family protein [Rathayibacter sp. AY1C7]QHC72893.1 glutaredoxin family protein [Rathayibacter sp. VKM Ac-2805]